MVYRVLHRDSKPAIRHRPLKNCSDTVSAHNAVIVCNEHAINRVVGHDLIEITLGKGLDVMFDDALCTHVLFSVFVENSLLIVSKSPMLSIS